MRAAIPVVDTSMNDGREELNILSIFIYCL